MEPRPPLFVVAFGMPVAIGMIAGTVGQGLRSRVATGIVFAVMSQYFEPEISVES